MEMIAIVIRVGSDSLLVRDLDTGQTVRVNTGEARQFSVGDRIIITHSGAMTPSIPPQIGAITIRRTQEITPPPQEGPTEMRALVLQRRRNSLLVRDMSNNRQTLVNFNAAHHFCTGQRIVVQYDTIRLSNPPEIDAIDIIPVC